METEGFYMAEKRWRTWETVGLLVVLAAGNLLHFVYDWTGQSPIAAPLAAVNESTWEHMKLFITPWVLWSLVECIALRGHGALLPARGLGLLTGLAAIPALFYTYQGLLGRVERGQSVAVARHDEAALGRDRLREGERLRHPMPLRRSEGQR